MRLMTAAVLCLPVWLGSTALPADDPADIKEWPVPWENSRPRDPYVDGKGRVWFVGQQGNYLAHFDPKTGAFERYELEPGTGPHNLIVDADGHVWYAGNRNAHIGRLDPETRKITRYPMPDPAVRDPHTLIFDRNGDIWFTSQGGNRVGKLTRTTGEIRLIAPATPGARPYGIVIDSKNRPWIVLFGTNKLATVDPATMTLREIALPREGTRPRRIAVTSDDRIWYTDYAGGFLGRYDPATGKVQEWKAPGGDGARPYALVNDDRDRLWFVETGLRPNRFVGFDPKTETFFSLTQIASGGGAVRHMFFLAQAHEIWFGTDTNTIGRARIP